MGKKTTNNKKKVKNSHDQPLMLINYTIIDGNNDKLNYKNYKYLTANFFIFLKLKLNIFLFYGKGVNLLLVKESLYIQLVI